MQINLLAWRQIKKNQQLKYFYICVLTSLLLIMTCTSLAHYYLHKNLDIVNKQHDQLTKRIRQFQTSHSRQNPITHAFLQQKIQLYQHIKTVLDHLNQWLPKNCYLHKLVQQHKFIVFSGSTPTINQLSQLLKNLQTGHIWSRVILEHYQHHQAIEFEIKAIW